MSLDLYLEIEKLRKMNAAQLKVKYLEVFGELPRSSHRDFLRKKIAWRMQALVEGGLAERARRRALEIANDADLRIKAPPGSCGKLQGPAVIVQVTEPDRRHSLLPGMALVRDFRGKTYTVKVLDEGYEFDGQRFKSLSRIAREITGTNWNGYAFFGIERGTVQPRRTMAMQEVEAVEG